LAKVIILDQRSGRALKTREERAAWQQWIAKRMLGALDITVKQNGIFPKKGLMVSNHLGYLDVIAIASLGHAVFVSKSDVINWPLIGILLKHTGTILTYRNQPLKAAETTKNIDEVLKHHLPVVLFPEGTSTDGNELLPFRAPLFQPAHSAETDIVPVGIRYTTKTGSPAKDVCYWGDDTFFPHLTKLATLREITAHIHIGESEQPRGNRKESAAHFHKRVKELIA